jgi:Arc/MetJ family transcription regulator
MWTALNGGDGMAAITGTPVCARASRPSSCWRPGCRRAFGVYRWCMARTNVDIDDDACRAVMARYQLASKREAVNFALRTLAAEPLTVEEARRLRGSGWEADLDGLRMSPPA